MISEEGRAVLRNRDFALVCAARFAVTLAIHVTTVAIGWYIYDVTGSAFALAYLGVAGLIPAVALVLVTGWVADRVDRRLVMFFSDAVLTASAVALLWVVARGDGLVAPIYLIMMAVAASRAFHNPASQAIVPALVPPAQLSSAIAISSSMFQGAQILGPALGGILYAVDGRLPFLAAVVLYAGSALASLAVRHRSAEGQAKVPITVESLMAGFAFAWSKPVVFGAVALDAAVVMLGGVIVLLPVFAKDVLAVGPLGLGLLRAAPATGAVAMALWLAQNDYVKRGTGRKLFATIVVYGLATAAFGISTSFLLSLVLLAVVGASDMISVVIRHTMVQAETPDELRGRVASVNSLFISSASAQPTARRRDGGLSGCGARRRHRRVRGSQPRGRVAAPLSRARATRSSGRAGDGRQGGASMTAAAAPEGQPDDDLFRPLENSDFVFSLVSRFSVTLATQIQTVAVGWFVYDVTGSALSLGLVGLAAFLPAIALMLVTGYVSDRYDRRLVLSTCSAAMALASAGQLLHVAAGWTQMWPLYLTVMLQGAARAFYLPANSAMLPNLVSRAHFPKAIAISTAVSQAANISGPAVGGLFYALSPVFAFGGALVFFAIGAATNLAIRFRSRPADGARAMSLDHLFAGFRFIWDKPVILGAMTLDVLVVALGGAVSLLPIFAKDVLEVGPFGLGVLRSAPAAGALIMGGLLSRHNFMERRAGPRLFTAVLIFGLANLAFGLSTSFALSFLALAVLGAADTASVVVRMTLVQAETPDDLRGRVAAVSSLFTQFSNEIGQFRAGSMAGLVGAVPATVFGGLGAVAIVLVWRRWFPALGARDHLVPPVDPVTDRPR